MRNIKRKVLCLFLTLAILVSNLVIVQAEENYPTPEWAKANGWDMPVEGDFYKTIDGVKYQLGYFGNRVTGEVYWQISVSKSDEAKGDITILGEIDGYPVTMIGNNVFSSNTKITSCKISEGVMYIGESAFYNCQNLEKVELPNTLRVLDVMSLHSCRELKELVIPESVEGISRNAVNRVPTLGYGLDRVIFEGNAPEVLDTTASHPTMDYLEGVKLYINKEATGFNTDQWTCFDINYLGEVDSVQLDKDTLELKEGETATLKATYSPENAVGVTLNWTSMDESIATVKDGVVTAKSAGTTSIMVGCGDKFDTVSVTVKPSMVLEDILLSQDSISMSVGEEVYVEATLVPEGIEGLGITWASSNPSVATVEDGFIRAVGEGKTTIKVICKGVTKTINVEVSRVNVELIELNYGTSEIKIGEELVINYHVVPYEATYKNVKWGSSNNSVATVKDGVVTGVGEGKVIITATCDCGNVSESIELSVIDGSIVEVTGVLVDTEKAELKIGEEVQVNATVLPENATNSKVVWLSKDESVATVKDGLITAIGEGTTSVVASCGGKDAVVSVTVLKDEDTVVEVTKIELSKDNLSINVGQEDIITAKVYPENATNKEITWVSADTSVVTVNNGVIKGIKEGVTEVMAVCGNVSASIEVKVVGKPIVPVESIELDTASINMYVGETHTINAKVKPDNATNKLLLWKSENESIATVKDGVVTGVKEGSTYIVVSCENILYRIPTTINKVLAPPIIKPTVELSKTSLLLGLGSNEKIEAWVTPEDYEHDGLTWTVADSSIAKVEDGVITGIGVGHTTITVSCGEAENVIEVNVVDDSVKLPFVDVQESDWFYKEVVFVYEEGLMTGMDEIHFSPYECLSRAMFVTILHRMYENTVGEKKVASTVFKDIKGDEWYAESVYWAKEAGVVTGYQDGNFGPSDLITREQMAVMLYRYANYVGLEAGSRDSIEEFKDASSVSGFAYKAMNWAVAEGIITGKDNATRLDPQGDTTRAECAVIITRFLK